MIYEAVMQKVKQAWKDGEKPNGLRMGKDAYEQLQQELTDMAMTVMIGKTSYGLKITMFHTEFGSLRLLYDKDLGDGFVVTCAIKPDWTPPAREETDA